MPFSTQAETDIAATCTSTGAATRIQAAFRRYKVQLTLLKAKLLFKNIHNEIENTIGQSSSFLTSPAISGSLDSSDVLDMSTDQLATESTLPFTMLPSANLLPEELQEDKSTINESSTDPQLDELESQPEPRKQSLEELLAEEQWLENVLRQRLQGLKELGVSKGDI